MKNLYLIIIVLTLIGCSNSNSVTLESELDRMNVFDESEIQDLSNILKFFNDQICATQEIERAKIIDCYESFFQRMEKGRELGVVEIKIPYSEQQKMYERINQSTFNEIWSFGKSWHRDAPEPLKHLCLKIDGKYSEFLKTLGKENNVIANYYNYLRSSGDISPSMVASLLMNHELYDIRDNRIKLIVAIHYLTLNDQYERKEKY